MSPFHGLSQPHHVTASHPSSGDKPPELWREIRKNTGTKQKWTRETQYFIYAQGLSTPSYLVPPPTSLCCPRSPSRHPSSLTLIRFMLPFYCSSYTHLLIPNSIHSWHSNQTSQTLHFKHIHLPFLSTSHTPCLCSVKFRWYNYSFI